MDDIWSASLELEGVCSVGSVLNNAGFVDLGSNGALLATVCVQRPLQMELIAPSSLKTPPRSNCHCSKIPLTPRPRKLLRSLHPCSSTGMCRWIGWRLILHTLTGFTDPGITP